jgi:hypothetical protein
MIKWRKNWPFDSWRLRRLFIPFRSCTYNVNRSISQQTWISYSNSESMYLLTIYIKRNFIILMPVRASALLCIKTYCYHNVTFCCLSLSCRKEQYLLWRFHASPLLILLTMDVREAYAYTHIRRLFISSFFSVVLSFWSFDLFIIIYSFIHSFG